MLESAPDFSKDTDGVWELPNRSLLVESTVVYAVLLLQHDVGVDDEGCYVS